MPPRPPMKFDLFYQLPEADSQTTARRYRDLIAEAAAADTFGFDTIWLAEVHFAPHFSVMPAPMMLLAAIAERTERLRLGLAVNLVPLHHPMRLAEETAMLDVLSGGRVEFGAGRGAFNLNYRGYGVDIETSRELFAEGLEFVQAAWTQHRVKFSGKHFSVDGVEVIPKPIQRPHPPIRLAANSPETFVYAGEHGYRIFAGGPVNPFPVLGDRLKLYDDALKKAGHQRPDDWLAGLLLVFAGRDRASVRTIVEPSLRNYFNSVLQVIEPQSNLPIHHEDFEKLRERLRAMQYETAESIMGAYGEPEYIADKIAELRERFGFDRLVCWFETGGISGHENVIESMRLFAERVMPRFQ
jgi:alkanesulfonate monooxygenase SsuD/methylene tetrahydromethanopterin reductase-like flavin-dependent oxidoreductase (luciferase family)